MVLLDYVILVPLADKSEKNFLALNLIISHQRGYLIYIFHYFSFIYQYNRIYLKLKVDPNLDHHHHCTQFAPNLFQNQYHNSNPQFGLYRLNLHLKL